MMSEEIKNRIMGEVRVSLDVVIEAFTKLDDDCSRQNGFLAVRAREHGKLGYSMFDRRESEHYKYFCEAEKALFDSLDNILGDEITSFFGNVKKGEVFLIVDSRVDFPKGVINSVIELIDYLANLNLDGKDLKNIPKSRSFWESLPFFTPPKQEECVVNVSEDYGSFDPEKVEALKEVYGMTFGNVKAKYDDYEFVPNVTTPEEVARYLIKDCDLYEINDNLKSFIEYEKLGIAILNEGVYKLAENGLIRER